MHHNDSIKFITNDYRGTKVPEGNLKYSYLKIMHQVGHYSLSLPNSILVFDVWRDVILENSIAHNIDIDNEFLESLRPIAKHLYADNIPSAETISQIICNQFEKAGRPAQYKDGTKLSKVEFKKLISGSFGDFVQLQSVTYNNKFMSQKN